jgi:branched-subunit amino acid ABC-type transport system permease component
MGIKPDMVISATFIIGAMLAAIAGVMWASNYGTVQHAMGFMPGLKAFTWRPCWAASATSAARCWAACCWA